GIGGMVGFVGFLLSYRRTLAGITFKVKHWRMLSLPRPALIALWVTAVTATAGVGLAPVKTQIDDFQYATPRLKAEAAHFEKRGQKLGIGSLYAIKINESPWATYLNLKSQNALLPNRFHPLDLFRDEASQRDSWRQLQKNYSKALEQ